MTGSDMASGSSGSAVDDTDSGGTTGSAAGSSGSDGSSGTPITSPGTFPFRPSFILGADISWTLEDEARGATYSDGTSVKPIEQIMANNGFNYIRLRTFVEPSANGGYSQGSASNSKAPGTGTATGGWCSTAATVAMAKRVKKCGMGLFVDFHMSDTWCSIGSQTMPSSWASLSQTVESTPVSASTKQNNIYQTAHDYVAGVMSALIAAGAKPDMVQIGNETNSGICGLSLTKDHAAVAGITNAGITAVREADPKIIVWAQNGRPRTGQTPPFTDWVDHYLSGKGADAPAMDEDGICGSTYGTTNMGQDWMTSFQYVITTYNKPVMSCEYTDVSPNAPAGNIINTLMHGFANHMGYGSFIWEPTRYPSGKGPLFDSSGNKYTTNALMTEFPTLAKQFNLPVPSGTCQP